MELTWITGQDARPLVEGNPEIAEVVTIEDWPTAAWRHRRYDWVISLDDDEALCKLASTLSAGKISGGFWDGARCAYTPDFEPWFGMGLLRPAGAGGIERANELKRENTRNHGELLYECLGLPQPIARPFIAIPALSRLEANQWLRARGLSEPLIGLNTGAGTRWRLKSWGEEQTSELARALVDQIGASVMIMGGASETERNQRIVAGAGRNKVKAAPTNLEFASFAALIDKCDVFITSDSLGLHLATALSKRIVAFFGPTSAAEINLYGLGEKLVTPLECRVCYLRNCEVRPHCMESIPVRRVLEAAVRQLSMTPSYTFAGSIGYGD
jgi:heptosyltransferase-2